MNLDMALQFLYMALHSINLHLVNLHIAAVLNDKIANYLEKFL